ncbi:TRAP transporter fused permease subunit [Fodinicurvata sp. EGI_FJ10296]|uniref:TRAP transporter permease n=1 Tax=Fodinicurvata sp. EGI_FJ10296 TaxID=3231908 RepID=UPI003456CDCA
MTATDQTDLPPSDPPDPEADGMRPPGTFAHTLAMWLGAAISILHIYLNTLGTMSDLWFAALHFGTLGFLCALLYPVRRATSPSARNLTLGIDIILGVLALSTAAYLMLMEEALYDRGITFIATDWIFSVLAVLLVLEFVRRTTGWTIPILIMLAMGYTAGLGIYMPGVFQFPGLSAEIIFYRSYFGSDGMFGQIARISYSYVFMFILFGAFLLRSGGGDFMINLSRCATGRLIGGPGFVAVLGSSLMGSITGSATANVVSTGTITIPMMKRAGFRPKTAAGIETAASTGGQLMPPIMGAGVFIMASYTQISYLYIIGVALLPAILYFMSVAFWVRIEAMRLRITGADLDAPSLALVMRQGGHTVIPITVLITLLVQGFTPTYAAGYSILAVIAASWISPNHRMGPRAIVEALSTGARNATATAVLLIGIGIVVNMIGTTSIGSTFSLMISAWSGGNLLIAIILVALASLILGMGLPVTAAYIVLATLSAPALFEMITHGDLIAAFADGTISQQAQSVAMLVRPDLADALGQPMPYDQAAALVAEIPAEMLSQVRQSSLDPAMLTTALLSAHMIIYWLSQDSNVTPPVCITAFAAAAIAKTPAMATGVTSWKIAKGLYFIPILFAFTPFLAGDIPVALVIFFWGLIGIYALSGAIAGYLEGPVNWFLRPVLLVVGGCLIAPLAWSIKSVAAAVFIAIFIYSRILWNRETAELEAEGKDALTAF